MKQRAARYRRDERVPEWTTCEATGKRRYASRKAAKRAAASAELKGTNAYVCSSCEGFHNGHAPKLVRDGDLARWELQP